jgi:hypothetical protein
MVGEDRLADEPISRPAHLQEPDLPADVGAQELDHGHVAAPERAMLNPQVEIAEDIDRLRAAGCFVDRAGGRHVRRDDRQGQSQQHGTQHDPSHRSILLGHG